MSQWTTQRGNAMPAIGQPSRMECWITCYQMILHATGLAWDLPKIEARLVAEGFTDAPKCRVSGISDEELVQSARALKMIPGKTSQINSLSGLKIMLQIGGPLWVAGFFPVQNEKRVVTRYKHVVTIIGVDEERQTVRLVNPWKQNDYDTAFKGWFSWDYIKESIQSTLNLPAGLQYLLPTEAVFLTL
jgi:hypothetical protein